MRLRAAWVIAGLLVGLAFVGPTVSACHRGLASTECATSIYTNEKRNVDAKASEVSAASNGTRDQLLAKAGALQGWAEAAPGTHGACAQLPDWTPRSSLDGVPAWADNMLNNAQEFGAAVDSSPNGAAAEWMLGSWSDTRPLADAVVHDVTATEHSALPTVFAKVPALPGLQDPAGDAGALAQALQASAGNAATCLQNAPPPPS